MDKSTGKGIIGIIPGSWETPENWDKLREELRYQDHTAVVAGNLPTQDPNATRKDYVQVAAESLTKAGAPISVLLAYSAGGLIVNETADSIQSKGIKVGHLVYLSASLGKPEPHTLDDPLRQMIPEQRNTDKFRKSILTLPNGMTIMEKKAARQLLFGDLSRKMARTAINAMEPHYRPSEPPLPEKHDIPGTYIWDPNDPVREPSWVLAIADALGLNTVKMRGGGHALHLSRPGELAQILGGLAGSTLPYTRVPQQRRTQIPTLPPRNADIS